MIDLYEKMLEAKQEKKKKSVKEIVPIRYRNNEYKRKNGKAGRRTCRIVISPEIIIKTGWTKESKIRVQTNASKFVMWTAPNGDGFKINIIKQGYGMIIVPQIAGVVLKTDQEDCSIFKAELDRLEFDLKPIEVIIPEDVK